MTVGDRTIQQMKAARGARTLHKKIIHEAPPTVSDWVEYGTACKTVDDFFKFLMSTPIDPYSQCISTLPFKRKEVEIMKGRIAALDSDVAMGAEETQILLDDLTMLTTSINSMYEMSVEWTEANFGVTRERLGEWRMRALVFKKTVEKKQKKLQEDDKAKNEIYSKNLKSRKLPNITEATWSKFIALWKTEEGNYFTQEAKLSVIRDRLENQTDKSCTEAMSTLEEVMSYLFKRYGSPNAIM